MKSIRTLLEKKGPQIWSIGPEASVLEAITLMAEKQVGALVVLEGDKLAGIISERDYARKVILKGKSSKQTRVREIMTSKVVCARPEQQIEECMAIMTNGKFRHMPVIDNGKFIGIVSLGDLVKVIIAEQKFTIAQLESYISG